MFCIIDELLLFSLYLVLIDFVLWFILVFFFINRVRLLISLCLVVKNVGVILCLLV